MKKLLIALALVALSLTWGHSGAQQAEAQTEACCFPDGTCADVDPATCTTQGGYPAGPGSACLGVEACVFPDDSCVDMDALCCLNEGGTPAGPGSVCLGVEACCYPDGSCSDIDAFSCLLNGGDPAGPGSMCLGVGACVFPDGSCADIDALCCLNEGGTPAPGEWCLGVEACCYPDGSCAEVDALSCLQNGGDPAGPGSMCLGVEACAYPDGSCADMDALCCLNQGGDPGGPGSVCLGVEACCYPDDSCGDHDAHSCLVAGGTPQGAGTNCAETVCGAPPAEVKWDQMPDETNWGLDVGTLESGVPLVLADDFLCEQSGLITQIDFWASWYHDAAPGEPPFGDPNLVGFTLSLHSDVPAGVDLPWSHPGELLWEYWFDPYQCIVEPWASDVLEGWFDPAIGAYVTIGDTQIWWYICPIPEPYWFQQEEGTIYWLDIQATPIDPMFYFGWKTSIDHWNDASVWAIGPEPVDLWYDLWHPPGHPLYGSQIDLAFQIWGQECDPLLDSDGDTFYDDVECYLPTDFRDDCPDWTGTPGLCPGPTCDGNDAWPLDMNVDRTITVSFDVLPYRGRLQATPSDPNWMQRLDLNMDNVITVSFDVLPFRGMLQQTCT